MLTGDFHEVVTCLNWMSVLTLRAIPQNDCLSRGSTLNRHSQQHVLVEALNHGSC